ncbi:MAG TPA: YbaN family protein [Guyparkeria sp.]|nr:YbaN family protein [Guyparkeria sp.]
MVRLIALILAYFFLSLAAVGVFLPGLPTVPFLILTAWFAARGSDRLHAWLYAHPHLGRLLLDWDQNRAVSRTNKIVAVAMLVVSWIVMYFQLNNFWGMMGVTALFVAVASYLVSRSEPSKDE